MILLDKKFLILVKSKVLDGRIFLTGKVDNPEEKLKLTKLAWETDGVRSVRNDIRIKENFNFKQSAKDLLITSQLRTALILEKDIKASNYQIDTYKRKIYIYGIAITLEEKDKVVAEATEILGVEDVVASILLLDNLRIQKN
jgi:osmotically-inducible protein OsmY